TMTLNDFNDYFQTKLESDDIDTIAGYYLTGVGTIPSQEEKETFELDSADYHLVLMNDKVKNGRVTKLRLVITKIEDQEEKD
ncbi:transporter associated domain-containing protein, partial [Streptococcus pyogenes]